MVLAWVGSDSSFHCLTEGVLSIVLGRSSPEVLGPYRLKKRIHRILPPVRARLCAINRGGSFEGYPDALVGDEWPGVR